jgi:signal transduction histidine kinase
MDHHGYKGGDDLTARDKTGGSPALFKGAAGGLVLASLFFLFSWWAPRFFTSQDPERSLERLRDRKDAILEEFSGLLGTFTAKHEAVSAAELSENTQERFAFLKDLCTDPDLEGIAYINEYGAIKLWYGQIVHINTLFASAVNLELDDLSSRTSLLVNHKSSVYLINYQELPSGAYVVFYRLLAFLPEFKARYLQNEHYWDRSMLELRSIDYHDFRDDISGTEEFFQKKQDEYVGQPQREGDNQSIYFYFPLRNEKNRIIATVTLGSPSLASRLAAQRETWLLLFYLTLGTALVLLILHLMRLSRRHPGKRAWASASVLFLMVGLRLLFFPLSRLDRVRVLDIFSPAKSGFLSFFNLTGSPADTFLTAMILFLGCVYLAGLVRTRHAERKGLSGMSILRLIGITAAGYLSIWGLYEILRRLVLHSSFSLMNPTPELSLLLIHLGIFLFFASLLLMLYTGFRISVSSLSPLGWSLGVPAVVFAAFVLVLGRGIPPLVLLLQGALGLLLLLAARSSQTAWRRRLQFGSFLAAVLLVFVSFSSAEAQKNRTILQDSMKNSVLSQEDWGRFFIQQSVQEIDNNQARVVEALKSDRIQDFARELWRGTLLAKSNWYSSLELYSSDGVRLSRFSLNIPEMFRPHSDLPQTEDWRILPEKLSYWTQEKDFLIAYKDWYELDERVGRTIILLSLDYEMLPFLYSGNPYFELLRIASYPSVDKLQLRFAVFDFAGKLIFNPHNLSSGLPQSQLQAVQASDSHIWDEFHDTDRSYNAAMFVFKERIYALLLPKDTAFKFTAKFLKLLFIYSACLAGTVLLYRIMSSKKNGRGLLWSFSNRVYLAFVVIALAPLLLFSMSTQNFFERFYAQKVAEEAESHANFAHRVMEDYVFQQQEDQLSLTIPPEELIIWISNAIAHDVHLYLDGRIYGSSHREFFEYGLLPDFIDGEIYYKIQYENNPLYTQSQRIGDYSFHTLTIPYNFQDNILLISLPFPLEAQQVSRSTADLLEFLFLLSFLFIVVVLLFGRAAGATITSPIRKLLAGTKEVGLGNLEISIPYRQKDEMKTLINGFNDMVLSLKKHQQELTDLGKKVAWAEMARKVAHEIKNPLTPIQLSAEHLLSVYRERPENFEEALKESTTYIVTEVDHLRRIAQEFLETSKNTMLQREELDLREILQETLEPYRKILEERIQIRESHSGGRFIFSGDRAKIKIVLRNILTNAIESIGKKGRIDVVLTEGETGLQLDISDTGKGLEPDILERIFEPYFSTKDSGTGLGLPIAKKIIQDHGGTVLAAPNQPQGLSIRIILPRS